MTTPPDLQQNKIRRRKWPLCFTIALAISGCGSTERVSTATVLAHPSCKGAANGLTEVSLAEVAELRGSQLVTPTSIAPEETTDKPAGTAPLPLFISISRGPQLSRGFELHLADQAQVMSPNALKIDVFWSVPDTSKPQPLVTTAPCLVVSVPAGPWTIIEAVDQHGELVGTLTRTPPAPFAASRK